MSEPDKASAPIRILIVDEHLVVVENGVESRHSFWADSEQEQPPDEPRGPALPGRGARRRHARGSPRRAARIRDRHAIQYACGELIRNAATVAIAAYSIERRSCAW